MLDKTEEWFVKAVWGRIACVSWGEPRSSPVLLVHGYMDSAATFIPILEHLPDNYYYVAFDMPGHGKSDPFPLGPVVTYAHQVEVVHQVVEHLKWKNFMFMAHSVGFIIGAMYNCVYPFRITKMVNIDPRPPLSTHCAQEYTPNLWYQFAYEDYYENFPRWEYERSKRYTYDQAINLLVRSRNLSKEQSAVVLSRILVPTDDGRYRLSWEPSMKKITATAFTEEMLIGIIVKNAPPMLNILASEDNTMALYKGKGGKILKRLQESIPNFTVITVTGTHDIHITSPEAFVDKVIDFLNSDVTNFKAKL